MWLKLTLSWLMALKVGTVNYVSWLAFAVGTTVEQPHPASTCPFCTAACRLSGFCYRFRCPIVWSFAAVSCRKGHNVTVNKMYKFMQLIGFIGQQLFKIKLSTRVSLVFHVKEFRERYTFSVEINGAACFAESFSFCASQEWCWGSMWCCPNHMRPLLGTERLRYWQTELSIDFCSSWRLVVGGMSVCACVWWRKVYMYVCIWCVTCNSYWFKVHLYGKHIHTNYILSNRLPCTIHHHL